MNYKITLTSVVDVTVTVEADSEDEALDKARELANQFADRADLSQSSLDFWVAVNNEWQYEDPRISEVVDR